MTDAVVKIRVGRWLRKSALKLRSGWRGFWRALRDKIYWLILLTALAGMLRVPWWVVLPLTVAGLSIESLPKYIALWERARDVGAAREWWMTVAMSTFNSLAAASGAYLIGVTICWLWW